jgi:hypothetical protein
LATAEAAGYRVDLLLGSPATLNECPGEDANALELESIAAAKLNLYPRRRRDQPEPEGASPTESAIDPSRK